MMLGRIILATDGEAHSLIRKKWLTKIFVAGDVLSFFMQGGGKKTLPFPIYHFVAAVCGDSFCGRLEADMMMCIGGGIMASGTVSAVNTGEKIIIGGLVVQLLFFGCFVVTGIIFHLRMRRVPTATVSASHYIPWERQLMSLYGASMLILVRCIFRLIEYAQGNDGYLISHEVFLYVFDAVLMFATMALMAWIHPSEITALLARGKGVAVRNGISVYQMT
jgi:hypothetical protein